jgi:hypothetical protein
MKPTHPAEGRPLLTSADSVRIRDLKNEKAKILERLRMLGEQELAELVRGQIAKTQSLLARGRTVRD